MRALALVLLAACGGSTSSGSPDAPVVGDVDAAADAATDAVVDKAAACASSFGNVLTNSFGRVDGTILAVVPPATPSCAQPNSTHIVLQVTMNGAAYRMVVNVDVLMDEVDAPLAGPAWSEGWHTDAVLDYVSTLQVASNQFTQPADVESAITDRLEIGAHVSVFSTSSGGTKADSTHLIHRNSTGKDGAIVIDPDTTPHYLLFRFSNQLF